jgi:hypothetical protein
MARIRSIHPGMPSDETYMLMSMPAKAAWPLLWTECDDHGVFEWKPVVLKARIFPADNIDFNDLLEEWLRLGSVMKVEVDGRVYGLVRNFCRFQRPKNPSYRYLQEELANREEWSTFIGQKKPSVDSAPPRLPQSSGSATENPPQMKEEGGRREEVGGSSEPNGSGATAPVVSIDARTALFRAGLKSLQVMTGKPEGGCRTLVGKWLRDTKDNAKAVHNAILSAEENRVADPVPWIERSLRSAEDDAIYRGVL